MIVSPECGYTAANERLWASRTFALSTEKLLPTPKNLRKEERELIKNGIFALLTFKISGRTQITIAKELQKTPIITLIEVNYELCPRNDAQALMKLSLLRKFCRQIECPSARRQTI